MSILKVKEWQKIKKEQFKSVHTDDGFMFSHAVRYLDGKEFRTGDIVMDYNQIHSKVLYFDSNKIHLHLKDLKIELGSSIYHYTSEINDLIWVSSK